MHDEQHPQAGETIDNGGSIGLQLPVGPYVLEDWWDRLTGGSWMTARGNAAALNYAMRVATNGLPIDDEVVYGKVGAFGHLVHVSEIASAKRLAS